MIAIQHWTTKEGSKIKISDMTDQHLINTTKMLERKAKVTHESEIEACASCAFEGEMAQMAQSHFLSYSSWDDYLPEIYQDLIHEANKRKICTD